MEHTTGTSREPGESGHFYTPIAGPSNAGPGPSTASYAAAAPTVGHKAPAKRAAGTGSSRGRGGGGRGGGRGRGAPPRLGPPSTGRLAAPLASSSVVGQRSTRSANRPRIATLKLKFSDKGEVQKVQGGQLTSFLGNYSREADSDPDEPLVFEEQFILRVPDKVVRGDKEKGIKGIKTLLEEKKEVNNASFKFKDTRRAVFNHGGTNYAAKLVDLPCIIEAQKTLDRKRLFKVADISQMLVVDPDPIDSEDQVTQDPLDPKDYVWPHGLTPPLRHVRERRWRLHRTGDMIKAEVDRLLARDKEAKVSSFDLLELDTHLDDQDGYDDEDDQGYPYREGTADSELGQDVPGTPWSQGDGLEEGSAMGDMEDRTELGSVDGDGDMDMDLEAALNRDEDEGATDEEDEDEEEGDDDDDEAEEEEEDEEIVELRAQQRLLEQEASALEEMVSKKTQEMQNVSAMIRMRIQRDVTKYQADLASKIKARDENQSKIDSKVEAKDKAREVKEIEKEDEYDGLFGEDEEEEEDDRRGENGDEDDEDDEWDQIFANEDGAATSTPGHMSTPRDNDYDGDGDNRHRGSSIANHGTVSLNSPEHHDEDDDDEEEDEEEDDEDEDAEGEDDDDGQDAMDLGAPAPFVPPIANQGPIQSHAPATGGWGYVESDEDEDDD